MDIVSLKYILLSGLSIFIYYSLARRFQIAFLVLISCIFIATYQLNLLIYVIIYSTTNYFFGLIIVNSRFKKIVYNTGIFLNLCQLIILKYSSFLVDPLFGVLNSNYQLSSVSNIIIPIGISYFTLQGIGYLINVKIGWEKPEKRYLEFLLYIVFFPKYISGPIERSNHFLPQLKKKKAFNAAQVSIGLRIALFGFFKKVAIANQLATFVKGTYSSLETTEGSMLWILMLIQPLYLYFDFSGYTDIAIGIARAFGIELLPNFNRPFFSENISTLWRRMHMSLSLWFNDYVFKQLSFKLRAWRKYASAFAVFVTFTLFGIWHGAGWNFMILGFLQALAINYEFFTKKIRMAMFSAMPKLPRMWVGRLFTYLFFSFSHIFFFCPDMKTATTFLSMLFKNKVSLLDISLRENGIPIKVIAFIFIFLFIELLNNDFPSIFKKLEVFWSGKSKESRIFRWVTYYLVIITVYILSKDVQEFIYFQF